MLKHFTESQFSASVYQIVTLTKRLNFVDILHVTSRTQSIRLSHVERIRAELHAIASFRSWN